jgi:hypothetical protein
MEIRSAVLQFLPVDGRSDMMKLVGVDLQLFFPMTQN